MKFSRDGVIPQLEPEGWVGTWQTRLGGARRLFQRSGIVSRPITMWGAITAAWGSFDPLQTAFPSYGVFVGAAFLILGLWGIVDFAGIMPGEQKFGQTQSQRTERSPLKRDTEEILTRLDRIDQPVIPDGGDSDDVQ